jgi:RimJ/RimL family protein N-acetyltransferase
MILHVYTAARLRNASGNRAEDWHRMLDRIADGTETSDLVVALYLLPGPHRTHGTAYAHEWMTPSEYRTGRGRWKISLRFPQPGQLPDRYKLIRLRLDPDSGVYPRDERDMYGWVFRYSRFTDHLVALFAHELHHYRRHHLGLHPRGGEHAANEWALDTVKRLGFHVEGRRVLVRRRRRAWKTGLVPSWLRRTDPHARLRRLSPGSRLIVSHDPRANYLGQEAVLVRRVRHGMEKPGDGRSPG